MNPICALCKREITPQETMFCQVVGWERASRGGAGGTNALKLRTRSGPVAHSVCLDRRKAGTLGQETLL